MSLQKKVEDQSIEIDDVDPLKFATKHSSEKFEFPTSDTQSSVEDSLEEEGSDDVAGSERTKSE